MSRLRGMRTALVALVVVLAAMSMAGAAERPHPYRDGPVKLVFTYDSEPDQELVVGANVTAPGRNPKFVGLSNHRVSGHSLTWDLVLDPALIAACSTAEMFGLCRVK
jgi:predicted small secreted protein